MSLDKCGALLRGKPGSGKSDLALRFIYLSLRHVSENRALIADDQVRLERQGDHVMASCPSTIVGQIEVRGVGIMTVPALATARLGLIVDLVADGKEPRLPPTDDREVILGISILRMNLCPFVPSTPIKLALALQRISASAVE